MGYVKCHCQHSKDSHEPGGLSCTLCECTLYRPESAADPFKNSVQQKTIRLLTLAKESDYPKTRKLGARIEELLGELELISEQEQLYRAEVARQQQERQAAEKKLEEARAILADAEAAMAKFAPEPIRREGKRHVTVDREKIPCPYCDRPTIKIGMGAHKKRKHPEEYEIELLERAETDK